MGEGGSEGNVWADLNSSNQLQTRYLRGDLVDQLFARISSAGTAAWYLTDIRGSVRGLTDNSGVLQDTISYDGFGRVTNESNASFGDRYKYTGRELDSETGLQYNRARYYDATKGRWTSQDPLGFGVDDTNLYRYVANSSPNATDPSGMAHASLGPDPYNPEPSPKSSAPTTPSSPEPTASGPAASPTAGAPEPPPRGLKTLIQNALDPNNTQISSRDIQNYIEALQPYKDNPEGADYLDRLKSRLEEIQSGLPGQKGQYGHVGGHHVHAKASFKGPGFDPNKGFSISQQYMKSRGWDHQAMTNKQKELFNELARSQRPNTMAEQNRIAEEALVAGGATRAEAQSLVKESVGNLAKQGITAPSAIPWNP
jgi:RHS repeat-associated protein